MKSVIKIGRDNTNDVIINEPGVSRNHAIISALDNDTYEVKDLGSSNGTFVNGQRVTQQIISSDDKLHVASCTVDWQQAFGNYSAKKTGSIIEEDAFATIRKTIRLGSSQDNDIVFQNAFVSAHHAKISLLKNGEYYLQDMGSSNGSFVNGTRINKKNFSKTDIVKIADTDLPNSWFRNKNLKTDFYKDNKKRVLIFLSVILLIGTASLGYVNRCKWIGWGCSLNLNQLYLQNKNSLVHIEHEYYYYILFKGKKYYVGKNKDFTDQTEGNPDKKNILPYNKISGNGCFIAADGSVLTTTCITQPWLNNKEKMKMLREVVASKTINGLKNNSQFNICGETTVLRWIQNGVVNNPQNFVEGNVRNECVLTDYTDAIIQSVKRVLPVNATVAKYFYSNTPNNNMHNSAEKYYADFTFPASGEMLKDTFYLRKDRFDINKYSTIPISDSLPNMTEGNPVFNLRGELIGLIHQGKVTLLQNYINQIKH
jgi:pSer/pThr/pTyr-binding forkhead associated (FHA) protein